MREAFEIKINKKYSSRVSRDRLTNLALLNIEHEYAKKINFDSHDNFSEVSSKTETVILLITVTKLYARISIFFLK